MWKHKLCLVWIGVIMGVVHGTDLPWTAWTGSLATLVPDLTTPAPDGTQTAQIATETFDTTPSNHFVSTSSPVNSNTLYWFEVYAKDAGASKVAFRFGGAAGFGPEFAVFDLVSAAAYVLPQPSEENIVNVTDVGDGWLKLGFMSKAGAGGSAVLRVEFIENYETTLHTGSALRSVLLWDPVIREASLPPPSLVTAGGYYPTPPMVRMMCPFPQCSMQYSFDGTSYTNYFEGDDIALALSGTTTLYTKSGRVPMDVAESPVDFTTYHIGNSEALTLNHTAIDVGAEGGSVVGQLRFAFGAEPVVYKLVGGPGDDENSVFEVVGDLLRLAPYADLETLRASSLSIRVHAEDGFSQATANMTISVLDVDLNPFDQFVLPTTVDPMELLEAPGSVASIFTGDTTIPSGGGPGRFGFSKQLAFNYTVRVLEHPNSVILTPVQVSQGGLFDPVGINSVLLGASVTHAHAGTYTVNFEAYERDSSELFASRTCTVEISCAEHAPSSGVAARVVLLLRGKAPADFTSEHQTHIRRAVARGLGSTIASVSTVSIDNGDGTQGVSTEFVYESATASVRAAPMRGDDTIVSLVAMDIPHDLGMSYVVKSLYHDISAQVSRSMELGCSGSLLTCENPVVNPPTLLWDSARSAPFEDEVLVAMSSTQGEVHYTLDGTEPITSVTSASYSSPLIVNTTTTVKAATILTTDGVPYQSPTVAVTLAIQAACGNGVVGSMETCDDGNNVDGDGCSSDCRLETASGQRAQIAYSGAAVMEADRATAEAHCQSISGQFCAQHTMVWALHSGLFQQSSGSFWLAESSGDNAFLLGPHGAVTFTHLDINNGAVGVLCCS